MRRVIVATGPAWTPIDGARRITNFSTGETGTRLAEALLSGGADVLCLRGDGATFPAPAGVECRSFSTNDSLMEIFRNEAPGADAIFLPAALCDFEIERGEETMQKIPSHTPSLVLHLRPALKVLPQLRELFPQAFLAGWKYELDGLREDALEQGRRQIERADTNLCVVNGAAYGAGFGILGREGDVVHCADKEMLIRKLTQHFFRRLR